MRAGMGDFSLALFKKDGNKGPKITALVIDQWHVPTRVDSRDLQTANVSICDLKIPLFWRGGISEDLKSILITV